MEQVWFVGAHSDVGGGSHKPWFSDVALRWMYDKAQLDGDGLEFDSSEFPGMDERFWAARITDSFRDMLYGLYRWFSKIFGGGRYYRPVKRLPYGNESVHETALQKIARDPKYNPKNPGLQ